MTKKVIDTFFPHNQATPAMVDELNKLSREYHKNFVAMENAYILGNKELHEELVKKERELHIQEVRLRNKMRISILISDPSVKGGSYDARKYCAQITKSRRLTSAQPKGSSRPNNKPNTRNSITQVQNSKKPRPNESRPAIGGGIRNETGTTNNNN